MVELTLALHRVFDSPNDPIIFDTGHQSYVHKLLTGRQDFTQLRSRGGLAGYPQRSESPHDVVESSHASSSLSWADGVSRALTRTGRKDRHVIAVVGDGSLTGGMTWEALNNISDDNDRNLVIIVNDNGRSYAPTIGGMARYLNRVRTADSYQTLHKGSDSLFGKLGPAARAFYRGVRGGTHGFLSRFVNNAALYSNLDIKYLGPVDGHDLPTLIETLELAKDFGAPVIVHAITEKGRGYQPARDDEADQFHAVGRIDPASGVPVGSSTATAWTDVFADELVAVGEERPDVIGITAAMLRPTGLLPFAQRFPDRVYDVGIAEQHAVASAAGLAYGGLHPVVAIYATFMNRAFDQVMMDVALHRAGVTFVLDRAGVTGPDGPSHHGIWDLAMLQIVPHIRIAVPRDAERLQEELREAVAVDDAPTVIRFPKGSVSPDAAGARAPERRRGRARPLRRAGRPDRRHRPDGAHRGRRRRPPARAGDRRDRRRPSLGRPRAAVDRRARGIPSPRHHDRGRHPRGRHRHPGPPGAPRGERRHRGRRAGPPGRVHRPRQPRADPRGCRPHRRQDRTGRRLPGARHPHPGRPRTRALSPSG